jgi:predicted nucleotidyltransferase
MDRKHKTTATMDKTEVIKIAQQYANAVSSTFDYKKIILFGSYAKGTYTADSDIDIAVVLDDYPNVMDMQVELMKLTRKIHSRIQTQPFREQEFEISNPLVNEILKYGQEI